MNYAFKAFAAVAMSLTAGTLAARAEIWTVYTYTPAATLGPAKGLARIAEAIQKDSTAP